MTSSERREGAPTPGLPAGPTLLGAVRDAIRVRHLSRATERTYVAWIRRFIRFHDRRHPRSMGEREVEQFLTALAVDGGVSAATQNQALAALQFLYGDVLRRRLSFPSGVVRAKRPTRLPVVLSRQEVATVLARLAGETRLVASLLYGSGLRLLECLRLRVKDVSFDRGEITIRSGKGGIA